MNRDWHIHSNFSDSSRSIEEIVELAKQKNCRSIAITDHDTMAHFEVIEKSCFEGLRVYPGIECTAKDSKTNKEIHILGYQLHGDCTHIKVLCEKMIIQRNEIAIKQIDALKQMGLSISVDEVKQITKNSPCIYKQHILTVLINKGLCESLYGDFYQKVFKNNGPCHFKYNLPTIDEVIQAIHKDGGIAIIAHPELSKCLDDLARYEKLGIEGIETYHSSQSQEAIALCNELAKKYNWIETGGSDNHGEYGKEPEIGAYF